MLLIRFLLTCFILLSSLWGKEPVAVAVELSCPDLTDIVIDDQNFGTRQGKIPLTLHGKPIGEMYRANGQLMLVLTTSETIKLKNIDPLEKLFIQTSGKLIFLTPIQSDLTIIRAPSFCNTETLTGSNIILEVPKAVNKGSMQCRYLTVSGGLENKGYIEVDERFIGQLDQYRDMGTTLVKGVAFLDLLHGELNGDFKASAARICSKDPIVIGKKARFSVGTHFSVIGQKDVTLMGDVRVQFQPHLFEGAPTPDRTTQKYLATMKEAGIHIISKQNLKIHGVAKAVTGSLHLSGNGVLNQGQLISGVFDHNRIVVQAKKTVQLQGTETSHEDLIVQTHDLILQGSRAIDGALVLNAQGNVLQETVDTTTTKTAVIQASDIILKGAITTEEALQISAISDFHLRAAATLTGGNQFIQGGKVQIDGSIEGTENLSIMGSEQVVFQAGSCLTVNGDTQIHSQGPVFQEKTARQRAQKHRIQSAMSVTLNGSTLSEQGTAVQAPLTEIGGAVHSAEKTVSQAAFLDILPTANMTAMDTSLQAERCQIAGVVNSINTTQVNGAAIHIEPQATMTAKDTALSSKKEIIVEGNITSSQNTFLQGEQPTFVTSAGSVISGKVTQIMMGKNSSLEWGDWLLDKLGFLPQFMNTGSMQAEQHFARINGCFTNMGKMTTDEQFSVDCHLFRNTGGRITARQALINADLFALHGFSSIRAKESLEINTLLNISAFSSLSAHQSIQINALGAHMHLGTIHESMNYTSNSILNVNRLALGVPFLCLRIPSFQKEGWWDSNLRWWEFYHQGIVSYPSGYLVDFACNAGIQYVSVALSTGKFLWNIKKTTQSALQIFQLDAESWTDYLRPSRVSKFMCSVFQVTRATQGLYQQGKSIYNKTFGAAAPIVDPHETPSSEAENVKPKEDSDKTSEEPAHNKIWEITKKYGEIALDTAFYCFGPTSTVNSVFNYTGPDSITITGQDVNRSRYAHDHRTIIALTSQQIAYQGKRDGLSCTLMYNIYATGNFEQSGKEYTGRNSYVSSAEKLIVSPTYDAHVFGHSVHVGRDVQVQKGANIGASAIILHGSDNLTTEEGVRTKATLVQMTSEGTMDIQHQADGKTVIAQGGDVRIARQAQLSGQTVLVHGTKSLITEDGAVTKGKTVQLTSDGTGIIGHQIDAETLITKMEGSLLVRDTFKGTAEKSAFISKGGMTTEKGSSMNGKTVFLESSGGPVNLEMDISLQNEGQLVINATETESPAIIGVSVHDQGEESKSSFFLNTDQKPIFTDNFSLAVDNSLFECPDLADVQDLITGRGAYKKCTIREYLGVKTTGHFHMEARPEDYSITYKEDVLTTLLRDKLAEYGYPATQEALDSVTPEQRDYLLYLFGVDTTQYPSTSGSPTPIYKEVSRGYTIKSKAKAINVEVDSFDMAKNVRVQADDMVRIRATKGDGIFEAGSGITAPLVYAGATGNLICRYEIDRTYWHQKHVPDGSVKSTSFNGVTFNAGKGTEYEYTDPETGEKSQRHMAIHLEAGGKVMGTGYVCNGIGDTIIEGIQGIENHGVSAEVLREFTYDKGKTRTKITEKWGTDVYAGGYISQEGKVIFSSEQGGAYQQAGFISAKDGVDNYTESDIVLDYIKGIEEKDVTRITHGWQHITDPFQPGNEKHITEFAATTYETTVGGPVRHVSRNGKVIGTGFVLEAPDSPILIYGKEGREFSCPILNDYHKVSGSRFSLQGLNPKTWLPNKGNIFRAGTQWAMGNGEQVASAFMPSVSLGLNRTTTTTHIQHTGSGSMNVGSWVGGGAYMLQDNGYDIHIHGNTQDETETWTIRGAELHNRTKIKSTGLSVGIGLSPAGLIPTASANASITQIQGTTYQAGHLAIDGTFTGHIGALAIDHGGVSIGSLDGIIGFVDAKAHQDTSSSSSVGVTAGVSGAVGVQASFTKDRLNSRKNMGLSIGTLTENGSIGGGIFTGTSLTIDQNNGHVGAFEHHKLRPEKKGDGITVGLSLDVNTIHTASSRPSGAQTKVGMISGGLCHKGETYMLDMIPLTMTTPQHVTPEEMAILTTSQEPVVSSTVEHGGTEAIQEQIQADAQKLSETVETAATPDVTDVLTVNKTTEVPTVEPLVQIQGIEKEQPRVNLTVTDQQREEILGPLLDMPEMTQIHEEDHGEGNNNFMLHLIEGTEQHLKSGHHSYFLGVNLTAVERALGASSSTELAPLFTLSNLESPKLHSTGGIHVPFPYKVDGKNIYLQDSSDLKLIEQAYDGLGSSSSSYAQQARQLLDNTEVSVFVHHDTILPKGLLGSVSWTGEIDLAIANGETPPVELLGHEALHYQDFRATNGHSSGPTEQFISELLNYNNTKNFWSAYQADWDALEQTGKWGDFSSHPSYAYSVDNIFKEPWKYYQGVFESSLKQSGIHISPEMKIYLFEQIGLNFANLETPLMHYHQPGNKFGDPFSLSAISAERVIIGEIHARLGEMDIKTPGILKEIAPNLDQYFRNLYGFKTDVSATPDVHGGAWLRKVGHHVLPPLDLGLNIYEQADHRSWPEAAVAGGLVFGMDTISYGLAYEGIASLLGGPAMWTAVGASVIANFVPDYNAEQANRMDELYYENLRYNLVGSSSLPPSMAWKFWLGVRTGANALHTGAEWVTDHVIEEAKSMYDEAKGYTRHMVEGQIVGYQPPPMKTQTGKPSPIAGEDDY